jgi:ABC-type transporter MlaC component
MMGDGYHMGNYRRLLWEVNSMAIRIGYFASLMAVALTMIMSSGRPAAALEPEAARALVRAASDDMIKSFAGKELSPDEAKLAMKRLVDRYCDMELESRLIVGRYWSRAGATQQLEFQGLLNRFFVNAVGGMIHRVPADLHIMVQTAERDGEDRVVVHSVAFIPHEDGSAVQWVVMRDANGRLVIADVSADGVALVTTLNESFASVLHSAGGQLVALSASLRNKLDDLAGVSRRASVEAHFQSAH